MKEKNNSHIVPGLENFEHSNSESLKNEIAVLRKELAQNERELEKKNRELFIVQQELEYATSKYSKIYENSPNGFFTLDHEGSILKINSTGADQLAAAKEFLIHKSLLNFVVAEHRPILEMHLENVFNSKKRHTCEVKIERKNKSLFYALLESVPSLAAEGLSITCETAVSDITMLKVAEETIKESEARFQNMANTAPVLIWVTDSDALFTFVNNFWLQFTGRTIGQELGMGWLEGIFSDDLHAFMNIYQSASEAHLSFDAEFRLRRNDGQFRWVTCKGIPRFQSDGRFSGYIGSCIDINDQKDIEETILKLNEELKLLNSNKDKFFSIIAHDLKSPLSGVLGFTEILFEEYDELHDEEKKEFIEHSYSGAKNLMALLENLLEWSRVQIGSISFTPSQLHVESIVDEIFILFHQFAKTKNIKLEKKIDEGTNVFADKNMVTTILRNLVSNGIKFTNDGGVIEISAGVRDNKTFIVVKDSGIGITEENLKKLFRIDLSFSTPGTNKERGTGLGLLLCYELAQKNKGKISVESEVGKGTEFILTLPSVNI